MISIESKTELLSLGQRLRKLRIERRDRQTDFAARLGVSIPTLRKMEQGDPSVAIGTWVDAFWLLDRLDDMKKVLAQPESLFSRWEQEHKTGTRQRVYKK